MTVPQPVVYDRVRRTLEQARRDAEAASLWNQKRAFDVSSSTRYSSASAVFDMA